MYKESYEKIYAECERIGNSVNNVTIYRFQFSRKFTDNFPQGGTSILGGRGGGGGGGFDLTVKFGGRKFGARSGQVHQIRGKTWEVLLPQDAKVGKKSRFWDKLTSEVQRAKFGVFVTLYFWTQNLGLQQEFQRQILGPSLPDRLI